MLQTLNQLNIANMNSEAMLFVCTVYDFTSSILSIFKAIQEFISATGRL